MSEQKQLSPDEKKNAKGCMLVLAIAAVGFGYYYYTKSAEEKEIQRQADTYQQESIQSWYSSFIKDTSNNQEEAVFSALYLVDYHPETEQAKICNQWMQEKNIDVVAMRAKKDAKRKRETDSIYAANKDRITTPEGDDLHGKAFIIAKEFVKRNLKAPASADFSGEYSWGKVGYDDTYTITSTVDAQNSFGAQLRSKWSVRLRFNGGDWSDASSWTLIDINIQ